MFASQLHDLQLHKYCFCNDLENCTDSRMTEVLVRGDISAELFSVEIISDIEMDEINNAKTQNEGAQKLLNAVKKSAAGNSKVPERFINILNNI